MSDDLQARALLRALYDPDDRGHGLPPSHGARARAMNQLLARAVELFQRYGLEATYPIPGSNIETFTFSVAHLTLRLRLRADLEVRGELRQTSEHGGSLGRPIEVAVCTLLWDVDEGRWYGSDGASAIDTLVAGLLKSLQPTR